MKHTFAELAAIIFERLGKRIKSLPALNIYAEHQSSFENWVNVELMQILNDLGYNDLLPEKNYFDIFSDELIIEIKIIKSGWSRLDADLRKLEEASAYSPASLKMLLFLFYPVNSKTESNFIKKIANLHDKLPAENFMESRFQFNSGAEGYMGIIKV